MDPKYGTSHYIGKALEMFQNLLNVEKFKDVLLIINLKVFSQGVYVMHVYVCRAFCDHPETLNKSRRYEEMC